jgi:hypothetical protein
MMGHRWDIGKTHKKKPMANLTSLRSSLANVAPPLAPLARLRWRGPTDAALRSGESNRRVSPKAKREVKILYCAVSRQLASMKDDIDHKSTTGCSTIGGACDTQAHQEIRRIRKYLGSPPAFGLLSVMACDFWLGHLLFVRKPQKLWPHIPSGSTVGTISAMVAASGLRSSGCFEIFHKPNELPVALSLPTQICET